MKEPDVHRRSDAVRVSGALSSRLARAMVPREIRDEGIAETVAALASEGAAPVNRQVICESPIFVLSAGWRSGSTLVQRLMCSGSRTLLWGEPFGDRVPVCRLASSIVGLGPGDPHEKFGIDHFSGDLSQQWVANLNPGLEALRLAHREFFETLFAAPAVEQGAVRWGAKWVRLSAGHAAYLKWLYPNARILFLVRHPLNAYLSYKGKRWYTVRPAHRINGVARFMAHWRYLAESFVAMQQTLGAMLVRYEDLTADSEIIDQLEQFVGAAIERETLNATVGSRDKSRLRISRWDRIVCRMFTGAVCDALGYDDVGGALSSTMPNVVTKPCVTAPPECKVRRTPVEAMR